MVGYISRENVMDCAVHGLNQTIALRVIWRPRPVKTQHLAHHLKQGGLKLLSLVIVQRLNSRSGSAWYGHHTSSSCASSAPICGEMQASSSTVRCGTLTDVICLDASRRERALAFWCFFPIQSGAQSQNHTRPTIQAKVLPYPRAL